MASTDVNANAAAPAAAPAAPASGAVTYEKGEKVLVLQTPLLYNAKVLKVGEDATEGNLYFVHYDGWKKKWDEWVPPGRMFKRNEDNLRLQQEYKARHNEKRKQQKEAKAGGAGLSLFPVAPLFLSLQGWQGGGGGTAACYSVASKF